MRILSLEGVRAGYGGVDVLHGVDLTVESGECVCVIGANGCGKTTLLRVIAGLLPARGSVLLGGRPIKGMKRREVAARVALLSQLTQVYFAYTVYDTVMLGRYLHLKGAFRRPAPEDRDAVRRCLTTVGLWEMRGRRIDALSGGQLQRVFLARTLAQEPLILLDEPTNHLDLKYQTELMESPARVDPGGAVRGRRRAARPDARASFADRLLLLKDGQAVAAARPRRCFGRVAEDVQSGCGSLYEARWRAGSTVGVSNASYFNHLRRRRDHGQKKETCTCRKSAPSRCKKRKKRNLLIGIGAAALAMLLLFVF